MSGFGEEANDSVLLLAATYYALLGYQQTGEMQTLTAWYMALHPDVLSQDMNPAMQALILASGEIRSLSREEQLKIGLMVLKSWSKSNKKINIATDPGDVSLNHPGISGDC